MRWCWPCKAIHTGLVCSHVSAFVLTVNSREPAAAKLLKAQVISALHFSATRKKDAPLMICVITEDKRSNIAGPCVRRSRLPRHLQISGVRARGGVGRWGGCTPGCTLTRRVFTGTADAGTQPMSCSCPALGPYTSGSFLEAKARATLLHSLSGTQ